MQVVTANGEEEFDGLPADHEYEVSATLGRHLGRCIWNLIEKEYLGKRRLPLPKN